MNAGLNYMAGTNYIENAAAMTDAKGTITFTIQPTSIVSNGGFYNCDFNGLQIMLAE